jgi:hypothetical protein
MNSETGSWSIATAARRPRPVVSRTIPKASESEILGEIDQTGKGTRLFELDRRERSHARLSDVGHFVAWTRNGRGTLDAIAEQRFSDADAVAPGAFGAVKRGVGGQH